MLYLLRAVYLVIHFLVICAYAVLYCLIFPRRLNNTSKLARMMSWSLPVLGINHIKKNQSPIAADQPTIYISNHQDTLDIFLHPNVMPDNIAILGKHSLKYVPIFGVAFWLAGNIFINRSDRSKAKAAIAEVSKTIRERGNSIYMFPEGTRSRGKGLLPFKKGAFVLAVESGLPIVPVVFSSTHKHVDINRWKAGIVLSEFLDPIDTKGLKPTDINDLLTECRNRIEQGVERLDQEVFAMTKQSEAKV